MANKPTQDDLHSFIKDSKNIAKAVEGSMEKRLESNRTVSKLLDRYFIMPTASILDENTKDGFAARDKQSKEVIESQLLALILDCMPEKKVANGYCERDSGCYNTAIDQATANVMDGFK